MKLSVVINSFNYAFYLEQCISSVIGQLKSEVELLVIDDGSTDDSLNVIAGLGSSFKLIAKENGGQASAFNVGFAASKGEWIWFLDADDWIADGAIETLMRYLEKDYVKFHFPLEAADQTGRPLGFLVPDQPLSEGDVIPEVIDNGGYVWPPTSGNVFRRSALEPYMPMPEDQFKLCADLYLCTCVAGSGKIKAIEKSLGFYRLHGKNAFHGFRLECDWLSRQFENLRNADILNTSLVKRSGKSDFVYRFNRRNLEMLFLSQRFGNVPDELRYNESDLLREWNENAEVRALRGISRIKAMMYLYLLRFAPISLIRRALALIQN